MNGHFIKNKNKNVQEPITVFSKIKKKKKKRRKKKRHVTANDAS